MEVIQDQKKPQKIIQDSFKDKKYSDIGEGQVS